MANYCGVTRTNYFRVKDEAKFRELMSSVVGEEEPVKLFENRPGVFGFGCYGGIAGFTPPDGEDCYCDSDVFYEALSECVADDDAIIITEIGNEKLRYLTGCAVVITSKEVSFVNLNDEALKLAKRMLGNEKWTTVDSY